MMDRPRIISHILQSVDGNIDGDFFTVPEIGSAYRAFSASGKNSPATPT